MIFEKINICEQTENKCEILFVQMKIRCKKCCIIYVKMYYNLAHLAHQNYIIL